MRAQTTLDFAIGVSVFLVVVTFVLVFIPGIVDPFVDGDSEDPVVANRVADSLSHGMLGDPAEPNVLDSPCTLAFFEEGNGDPGYTVPSDCRFEDNDVTVNERVGVQARIGAPYGLRVRVVGDVDGDSATDVLCNDGGTLTDASPGSCGGTAYTVGGTPPESVGSVSVARRAVYLPVGRGADVTILVEVW